MLQLTSFQRFAISVMKQGHIPNHIAFIMDGNRRFAQTKHNKAMSGHAQGAMTLKKCLLYCLHLGVKTTSFYAFSIENYKRNPEEVQFLMNLARNQFSRLSEIYEQDNILDIIEKNNVRVIIAGDLDGKLKTTFPDVREGFLKVQERTKDNTKMTMYLCFAFDSVYEYNRALTLVKQQKKQRKEPKQEEHTDNEGSGDRAKKKEELFSKLLVPEYIDILVRTSGESRLSNYMLMQVNYGLIYIEKGFWPAFSLLNLAKILLQYNYYYSDISSKRLQHKKESTKDQ